MDGAAGTTLAPGADHRPAPLRNGRSRETVESARRWLATPLPERFSLQDLSRVPAVSTRQLQSHFQQELGHSPMAQAKRLRLQRLRGLLLERQRDNCSVAELMAVSGLTASGVTSADYRLRFARARGRPAAIAINKSGVTWDGAAWALLNNELQASSTPESIKNAVATMIAHASGSIQQAQIIDEFTLEDWPGKQAGDLAVVYVALNSDSLSEAVTLTLAQHGKDALLRHLEWRRP